MNKIYLGCDPGKQGAIVTIDSSGEFIRKDLVPLNGKDIDIHAFYKVFLDIKKIADDRNSIIHVCLEDVRSIFGSSSKSNFTFGYVVGVLETIIVAHNLSYSKIAPKKWQENIWLSSEIEREPSKTVNGKTKPGKIKTKITSLKAAKRLFPDIDLRGTERSKIPHDGIVDALCIAECCRRLNH
jgi:hypothetical protein